MMSTIVLPSNLKSIHLLTRLCSDEDSSVQEHQAASFIQAFASQYPKIQQIDISYGLYRKGLYNAKWGRIRQTNDESLIPKGESGSAIVRKINKSGGYSSKSSADDHLVSTVTSTVNPLPLGKLTFTEHRRMILFQSSGKRNFISAIPWMNQVWLRLKRSLFGKS